MAKKSMKTISGIQYYYVTNKHYPEGCWLPKEEAITEGVIVKE